MSKHGADTSRPSQRAIDDEQWAIDDSWVVFISEIQYNERKFRGGVMRDMATIAVCDDVIAVQQQVVLLVQAYTKQKSEAVSVLTFSTAQELLTNEVPLDMLFLDIELEEDSGIDLVPRIREKHPEVTIIFISSHHKYFVYSHRLHVFQFLTKPFDQQIFFEELDRFFRQYQQKCAMYPVGFKGRKQEISIYEILYIEASLRHLLVCHSKTGLYEKTGQISREESRLESYGFIRCHNSYLVNARYITEIKNLTIFLTNPVNGQRFEIPASKKHFPEIKQQYQQWLLEQEG